MTGFIIKTKDNKIIRFNYYREAAPKTVVAFDR